MSDETRISESPAECDHDKRFRGVFFLPRMDNGCLACGFERQARELAETRREWRPIETAPYATWVLAWLHLPKNPIASAPVVAQRCHVERDDPESYSLDIRQTVGCWWANGRYYPVGHVTHWMPLPAAPKEGT